MKWLYLHRNHELAIVVTLIALQATVFPVKGIVKEGSIQSDSSFEFLAKFCFEAGQQGNEHGFHYSMSFPNTSKLAIIVYYKENGVAVNNWEESWTCQERLAKSRNVYYLNPTPEQRSANSPKNTQRQRKIRKKQESFHIFLPKVLFISLAREKDGII